VHAHDWHAGLAPAYIAQNPALTTASVFTIHNLAFRGLFPLDHYSDLGLLITGAHQSALEFHGHLSFMKSALVHAKRVNAVSPTYAREICTPEFGWGLEGLLRGRGNDLSGILNGVDYSVWDPAGDPALPCSLHGGPLAWQEGLQTQAASGNGFCPSRQAPLFAVVSRLTSQKGMDLILGALPALLTAGGQLVVVGSGEADIEAGFRAAAAAHPDAVSVHLGYDDALSHRIIAGADILLVPSRFEPCGLTQLYALRYGTLPLVRRVGGLADTVIDATPQNLQTGIANGFVFDDAGSRALSARIADALTLYHDPSAWLQVQRRGMAQDYSWDDSALRYEALYRSI
jgi:starch synthase